MTARATRPAGRSPLQLPEKASVSPGSIASSCERVFSVTVDVRG